MAQPRNIGSPSSGLTAALLAEADRHQKEPGGVSAAGISAHVSTAHSPSVSSTGEVFEPGSQRAIIGSPWGMGRGGGIFMRPAASLGSLQRRSLEGIVEQDVAEVARTQASQKLVQFSNVAPCELHSLQALTKPCHPIRLSIMAMVTPMSRRLMSSTAVGHQWPATACRCLFYNMQQPIPLHLRRRRQRCKSLAMLLC